MIRQANSPQNQDEFLTTFEAARLLKVDEKTIRQLAANKELPSLKVGRQFRFVKSELLNLGKSRK